MKSFKYCQCTLKGVVHRFYKSKSFSLSHGEEWGIKISIKMHPVAAEGTVQQ